MTDTIWYVYHKLSGAFAGSGITEISTDDYGSTTTAAPADGSAPAVPSFDPDTDTWTA